MISDKAQERDSYTRFLHPLFGLMTQWLGEHPIFDCTASGAEDDIVPGIQWAYGESEEKVL